MHDLLDSICNEFEQYAQAKEKSTGRPTIVRILDKAGGMNMRFGEVDIIPDEDLNTRLKFYVSLYIFSHIRKDHRHVFLNKMLSV